MSVYYCGDCYTCSLVPRSSHRVHITRNWMVGRPGNEASTSGHPSASYCLQTNNFSGCLLTVMLGDLTNEPY